MKLLILFSLFLSNSAFSQFNFFIPSKGKKETYVYSPKKLINNTIPRPAIVLLHGCFQNGNDIISTSNLKAIADRESLYIITPEQSYSSNPVRCWNWFDKKNQMRSQNEVQKILSIIEDAQRDFPIDSKKIILAGFSAGAAMANVLAYCHADMFSGALIMAGVKYAGATSAYDAFNVMKNGSSISAKNTAKSGHKCLSAGNTYPSELPKFLIVAGKNDNIVSHLNASQQINSNAIFYDLIDDSTQNNSIILTEYKKTIPVDGFKFAYTETDYKFKNQTLMKKIIVEEMGHGWSGGPDNRSYSMPNGPNVSEMMIKFFDLKD